MGEWVSERVQTFPDVCSCWMLLNTAQVRTDLVDTGIYVCEPDVLALFSDNWDYQVSAAPAGQGQADMSVRPAAGPLL